MNPLIAGLVATFSGGVSVGSALILTTTILQVILVIYGIFLILIGISALSKFNRD